MRATLFNQEANRLYRGDCLSVLERITPESVDLIYIDPPFFSNQYYELIWKDRGDRFAFEDRWRGGIQHYVEQEERFFHGYYGHYCYLPLYIVCGEYVLCARLRPSNIDGAKGSVAEVERIVGQIRQAWPQVRIILRGDSGFCREELLSWCEAHGVDYVVGLAQNPRLQRAIAAESAQAASQYQQSGKAARVFTEFGYQTRDSWSRARRVIAKAEHLEKGANPRRVPHSSLLCLSGGGDWGRENLYLSS